MLKLKSGPKGARIQGIRTELLLGIMIVKSVFDSLGLNCVITSIVDGKHSRGSLHYTGCGCDFRTKHIEPTDDIEKVAGIIKTNLGDDFDFVIEENHYHLEYQPKLPY